MDEAGGRRLDYVVLPRRQPGLALLERYFPSPAPNVLDAELTAFASPGDVVLDPWSGTGWTARRAIQHSMRAIAAEPSPFAQLAAVAMLRPPDPVSLDTAFTQLATSRRVDLPLSQHIQELYSTRCGSCRRGVIADQFIWPRGSSAPMRKVYRCGNCNATIGGPDERSSDVDATDLAKLGLEESIVAAGPSRDADAPAAVAVEEADEELPPAPTGLTEPIETVGVDEGHGPLSAALSIGETGGPPPPRSGTPGDVPVRDPAPRFASTVQPERVAQAVSGDPRIGLNYEQLKARFPILDGRDELAEELLALYTPRNLYALQAISTKIESEFRDGPLSAFMRLALAACLLPASRLNGYPGRVASLRIANGHVREPASRYHREVNVWRLFESAFRDVRVAVAAHGRDVRHANFAGDFAELGTMSTNVLWLRCHPAVVRQYVPPESVDLVVGAATAPPSVEELSFEYLATAWLIGSDAAATLRLEPLFASAPTKSRATDATVLRHAIASAAEALKPGGWFSVLLEGDDPDRMLSVALAGAAAGLDLVDIVPRESGRSGDGAALHLRRPSAEDRLRAAVHPRPLELGVEDGQLTYPEIAGAIERATVALLADRGEPARLARIVAAVLMELSTSGLLRRLAQLRPGGGDLADGAAREPRIERAGPAMLATLIREELWRDDHPAWTRLGDADRPTWWLRQPTWTGQPLADRVEWAAFSMLSTGGALDEAGCVERVYRLFPGLSSPDEELVLACVAAYAKADAHGRLHSEEEVQTRYDDHSRVIGQLADLGHRLGLRVWVSRAEQRRSVDGRTLASHLAEDERRAYLPLIVKGAADALAEVDAMWYVRGRLAFLFDVEWTATLGDPILKRGTRIDATDRQVRFLVFPAERSELVKLKLERSPWLRDEMERRNWHVLKWQHLQTLLDRGAARLESLEPMLGLDPLAERAGEQLTIFGE
ncbi:MAG: hypothetical protein ABR509_04745 [Candidatus Limnocylindria bacterium]